ncbi:MAG TPA: alpha/beta hydrolase [Chitinophagaceae bacterium]
MKKNLSFQNKNIGYHLRGEGMPVMLVHGFGEDHRVWDEQCAQLEKRFRLILPDLPGSGSSERTADVSMENLAASLHAILQEESVDSLTMLGHSMGGYVTLAFAAQYPDTLQAFGLVHSTAYADNEEKKVTRRKGIEFIKKNGVHEFFKTTDPNLFSEHTKRHNPGLIDTLINTYKDMDADSLVAYYEAMMERPDRTAVLKEFTRPILFLAGEHDTAIPYDQVMQQSRLPLLSYLHVLRQSGHMGMWEEPNQCTHTLEEFIKNNVL